MEKICPSCGKKFECKSDKIAECQCSKVMLTPQQRAEIKNQYDSCLCIDCIKKIVSERKK